MSAYDDDAASDTSTGPFVYESPWDPEAVDDSDHGVYTISEGTMRILERTASGIPVLSSSDTIDMSRKKTYGLRMIISTRIGAVVDTYREGTQLFRQSMHFRLPFPLRPHRPSGEECDILMNGGLAFDIDVLAPAYAPGASMDTVLPFTWNVEGCFHPNWVVWRRQVDDGSFRVSAGQKHWSSAVAHFFIPVEGGIQKAGAAFDKSIEFPEDPMTVHGYGVCDPDKYQWKDKDVLPTWLDEFERTNTMGFLRMTTRFNMKSSDHDSSSKVPTSGDYPFHVLLYWPRAAVFWRTKRWAATITKGGFFHVDGRTVHFVGKMIGLLNTSFLVDVPLGVFIPVIVPEQMYTIGDVGAGSGVGSGQFSGLKARTTPRKGLRHSDVDPFGSPLAGSSSAGMSPSADRGSSGSARRAGARKPRKPTLNALLGVDTGTSSGAPASTADAEGPTSSGVVDPDAALQSSITEAQSDGEGTPSPLFGASSSPQADHAMDVDPATSGGFDGVVDPDAGEPSDDELSARGTKRTRAGRAALSKKAAGKKRADA